MILPSESKSANISINYGPLHINCRWWHFLWRIYQSTKKLLNRCFVPCCMFCSRLEMSRSGNRFLCLQYEICPSNAKWLLCCIFFVARWWEHFIWNLLLPRPAMSITYAWQEKMPMQIEQISSFECDWMEYSANTEDFVEYL